MGNFTCIKCKKVVCTKAVGTRHRNHCPFCLWSLHSDKEFPGDRRSKCRGLMEPIGLTLKKGKPDKYGQRQTGELMLVHQCQKCGKISLNRIAGDDEPKKIIMILGKNTILDPRSQIKYRGIRFLKEEDRQEVERQLFGKKNC